jgi:transposase
LSQDTAIRDGWPNSAIRGSPARARTSSPRWRDARDHHRFLIGQHLKTIEQIEATIGEFDARLEAALAPFLDAAERLKDIPGFGANVVQTVLAEIGADMTAFPTADHLVSWAGMCPRLDESAGRKRSKRLRKGAPWLKPVLVQAALAAIKVKNSSLRARYFSLKPRLGHKKAIIAVAAAMLRTAYHMLKDGTFYQDLGPDYRARKNPEHAAQNLAKRIQALGYQVELKKAA